MALTDLRIRRAQPGDKPYKLPDGGGLYVLVTPAGSKLWRYKYRIEHRENVYSIGAYPAVSLLDARRAHQEARDRVREGLHPVQQRRDAKAAAKRAAANSFGAIAEEWFAMRSNGWSTTYAAQVRRGLDADLLPKFGQHQVDAITPMEWLELLRAVEKRGAPAVAVNLRQWGSAVYRLAVTTGRAASDPLAPLKGMVVRPPTEHAKALGRDGAGVLLTRINSYGGNLVTKVALQVLMYTFVRTVEMRRMEWSELDLGTEGAELWQIPSHKMKMRRIHLVPLPRQAVAALRSLRPLTGGGQYVFPNSRTPGELMPATTINRALEHMGYASAEVTGHDFRATASTMLYEAGYREELVETQLAHAETKKSKRAYNHAKYLDERRAMLQWLADEWDASAAEHAVLALKRHGVGE